MTQKQTSVSFHRIQEITAEIKICNKNVKSKMYMNILGIEFDSKLLLTNHIVNLEQLYCNCSCNCWQKAKHIKYLVATHTNQDNKTHSKLPILQMSTELKLNYMSSTTELKKYISVSATCLHKFSRLIFFLDCCKQSLKYCTSTYHFFNYTPSSGIASSVGTTGTFPAAHFLSCFHLTYAKMCCKPQLIISDL